MTTEVLEIGTRTIKPSEFHDPEEFLRSVGCDAGLARRMTGHFGSDLPQILLDEFQEGTLDIEPLPADGDQLRGKPRVSAPFTRIYMRMVRELGTPDGSAQTYSPSPTPTRAWLQVKRNMEVPNPSFTHKEIGEAVEAMGGYSTLRKLSLNSVRKQFIMTYKELVQGW